MHHAFAMLFVALAPAQEKPAPPVLAAIETTLPTAAGLIRQFAFDGNPRTYFASARKVNTRDHFTLVFDQPVAVKSVAVTTGTPQGGGLLVKGVLEVSLDGEEFVALATFAKGKASGMPKSPQLRAVRIRPTADHKNPLAIREIVLVSKPAVVVFKYPVEFLVHVDDAPEMKAWAEKSARICERWYSTIADELQSPGYRPPMIVHMTLKKDYEGVAAAGGDKITGSVAFFKKNPHDFGAMIHETVHIVQQYRTRGNPGWLVEGIADYVRFFLYEPGKLGKIRPQQAKYDGSYRVTAAFLGYLTEKYDPQIVRKLNRALREGTYSELLFKRLTRKTLKELDVEWRATLTRASAGVAVDPVSPIAEEKRR